MKTKDYLLDINEKFCQNYTAKTEERLNYLNKHQTAIMVTECIDGRVNFAQWAEASAGIVQPMRSLGGRYNLGWSHFNDLVIDFVQNATSQKRQSLIINTYHFSKSEKHLGCKGFGYDHGLSIKETGELRDQFEACFDNQSVTAILVGMETDDQTFVLHGVNNQVLNLAENPDMTTTQLEKRLNELYPQLTPAVVTDLISLFEGNLLHIKNTKSLLRQPSELDHNERMIGIGRGYDWLPNNFALLIGPFTPTYETAIKAAAGIIWDNIEQKRVDSKDGIVLMGAAPVFDPVFKRFAIVEARELAAQGMKIIENEVPQLLEFVVPMVGIINMDTLKLEIVDY